MPSYKQHNKMAGILNNNVVTINYVCGFQFSTADCLFAIGDHTCISIYFVYTITLIVLAIIMQSVCNILQQRMSHMHVAICAGSNPDLIALLRSRLAGEY